MKMTFRGSRMGTCARTSTCTPAHLRLLPASLLACLLVACAAAPPVRFHSLLPLDASERDATAGAGFVVTLAPVSVPPQVDQPQWLLRAGDGTLMLLEQERWASPLRSELRAALLDRWVSRWGGAESLPAPQTGAASAASAATPAAFAGWRVVVDVTRFESLPGREVRLDSRWSARAGQAGISVVNCRSLIRESVGEGTLALADGHRRAVTRLADDMARQLAALQRGESPACVPAQESGQLRFTG